MTEIDFEGNGNNTVTTEPTTPNPNSTTPDPTDLNDPNPNPNPNPDPTNDPNPDDIHDIEVGTEIQVDGATYTIDENKNLVDKDGNIFKEAKDVKAWIEEFNVTDGNEDLSIENIQNAVGVDIVDEQGNTIQFTDNIDGIKEYINKVAELKANEAQQGVINKLFADNPLLKQFIDYVQLTGSPKGFGELPDRSGIELDKDNESQLEAVIRMAAKEFGNASINDNYIKYLKTTGELYNEAERQLNALVESDKARIKDIETRAKAARDAEDAAVAEYWQGINTAINNRRIGEYLLPENITIDKNGQKLTLTLNDFYNYVSNHNVTDEEGNRMTGYQRDLNALTNEQARDKELLDAWLMFTGGSYKDLVNMAIKEEAVKKLILKSNKNANKKPITINKPIKGDKNDVVFE